MADDNRNPEQRARVNIHAALVAAGWVIRDRKSIHLRGRAGLRGGSSRRPQGQMDYVLYVDRKAAGTLEAKKGGVTLGSRAADGV